MVEVPDEPPSEPFHKIRVEYSGLNFKDALAITGRGRILRRVPLTAGIDAVGTLDASSDPHTPLGRPMLVTGGGAGESIDGGLSEVIYIPPELGVPRPKTLSAREAMLLGTAGFSAALALSRMEQNGQRPDLGPIVVTGANGGVGGWAVDLFSARGYEVIAVTGKESSHARLRSMGASKVVRPESLDLGTGALGRGWIGGIVDAVGGDVLARLLAHVVPHGNAVSVGMAGGSEFKASVMPFILRGVSLLGLSSSNAPPALRAEIWRRLGADLRPKYFELMCGREIGLDEAVDASRDLLDRRSTGRVLVRLRGGD